MREPIFLKRDCDAIQIPYGTKMVLQQGMQVFVEQELGGSVTVSTDHGFLARVDAKDVDALGFDTDKYREQHLPKFTGEVTPEAVYDQLRTCFDPEIPVNIVELGLIYSCDVKPLDANGKRVEIAMTLTAPGCGMGQVLIEDIERKVSQLPGVTETHVEMVFDPPWNQSMMSEAARLQLGML
jgi:probable FeS assembly SUF system protein SufT